MRCGAASRFVSKDDVKRAHPSQGEGRAQIVVEPKPELAFEVSRGSRGGAAERGACPTRSVIYQCLASPIRSLPSFATQLVRKRLAVPPSPLLRCRLRVFVA